METDVACALEHDPQPLSGGSLFSPETLTISMLSGKSSSRVSDTGEFESLIEFKTHKSHERKRRALAHQ